MSQGFALISLRDMEVPGFFNTHREGKPVTRRTLTEIAAPKREQNSRWGTYNGN